MTAPPARIRKGPSQSSKVSFPKPGFKQHELTVAGGEESANFGIRPPRAHLLANEHPQVMGKLGVRFIDRFVLADEAAKLRRQGPRARLERRVGEHLVGFDRKRGRER